MRCIRATSSLIMIEVVKTCLEIMYTQWNTHLHSCLLFHSN